MEREQVGNVSVLLTEIDQGVDEPGDGIFARHGVNGVLSAGSGRSNGANSDNAGLCSETLVRSGPICDQKLRTVLLEVKVSTSTPVSSAANAADDGSS